MRRKGPGRKPNAKFGFTADHPMSDSKTQCIRSRFMIPVLVGRPPPKHPGKRPAGFSPRWQRDADLFGAYYLSMFVPWDDSKAPPIPLNWASFCAWYTYGASIGRFDEQLYNTYVERCRRECVQDVARGMVVNKRNKTVLELYRGRGATRWNSALTEQPGDGGVEGSRGRHDTPEHVQDVQAAIQSL